MTEGRDWTNIARYLESSDYYRLWDCLGLVSFRQVVPKAIRSFTQTRTFYFLLNFFFFFCFMAWAILITVSELKIKHPDWLSWLLWLPGVRQTECTKERNALSGQIMQNPLPELWNRTLTNCSMANSTRAGMLFRGDLNNQNNQMEKIFLLVMKAEWSKRKLGRSMTLESRTAWDLFGRHLFSLGGLWSWEDLVTSWFWLPLL